MGSSEQKLIKVFVDAKFLDHFRKKKPPDLNDSENIVSFINLREFLTKNEETEFIFSENGVKASREEIMTFIKDDSSKLPSFSKKDKSAYTFHPKYNFSDQGNPFLLSFTSFNSLETDNLCRKQGLFFTNNETFLADWAKLNLLPKGYGDEVITESFNWEKLGVYSTSCNSIIITMPYLATWYKETIYDNFFPLLENIIDDECSTTIHLLLLTWYDHAKNLSSKRRLPFPELYNELNTILKGKEIKLSMIGFDENAFRQSPKFKEYSKKLAFIKDVIHPRYIFTNYRFYSSDPEWNYDRNRRFLNTGGIQILSAINDIKNRKAQIDQIRKLIKLFSEKPFSDHTYVLSNPDENMLLNI